MNNLITIDSGANGGICVNIMGQVTTHKMPSTYDLIAFFDDYRGLDISVYIEQLHAGSLAQNKLKGIKCIWSQVENYTAIKIACFVSGLSVNEVSPQKWMGKISGHGERPKDYKDRKNWLKSYAQKQFPKIKVTLQNSDCLAMMSVLYTKEFEK